MATEVILPRVDMDMATGSISRWFAQDGETVEKGAVLFEIETDKAAMEIDAPASGRLHRLAEDDGAAIPVGSLVAWILAEGEAVPEAKADASAPDAGAEAPAANLADSAVPATAPASTMVPSSCKTSVDCVTAPRATPLARRLARERKIDLAGLAGSGPYGRIQAKDVTELAPAKTAAVAHNAEEPKNAPVPASHAPERRAAPPAPGRLHRVWLRRGEGTPLVLIHGFGSESGMWRPLVAAMAGTRPVLALDLPGHGQSPAGATGFDAIVAAVTAALAEENVFEAHLVGHSLGSAVAVAVADSGAVGARSLFLLSPAGLGPDIDAAFLAGFTRARSEASLAPWMRMLVQKPASLPQSLVAGTARTRTDDALVAAQADLAASLFPDATQVFSVRAALARTSAPVSIVSGLADRIIPARHTAGLSGLVALHLFADVGHMPQLEVRDAVLTLLARHLG